MVDDSRNTIHDLFYELYDIKPSEEEIYKILTLIPEDIKLSALQWGWSDTVVKDDIYVWMKKNKNTLR